MIFKLALLSLVATNASRVLPPLHSRITGRVPIKNMTTVASASNKNSTYLVWMDLEMTGLNIETDKILEVSCMITDKNLNIQSESLNFAINHPQNVYEEMNEWCQKQHYKSGLVDACKKSTVTPGMAEEIVLSFLKENIPEKMCPLAGNSVYMDRLFLYKFMPAVNEYLHYRIVDVSTVKELARRWYPEVIAKAPRKIIAHRSLDDIKESIEELKFYKKYLFKDSP